MDNVYRLSGKQYGVTQSTIQTGHKGGGDGGDGNMEQRLRQLETDVSEIKQTLARLDGHLEAKLPELATKTDMAGKPGHGYMWAVLGVLVALTFGAVTLGAYLMG